MRKIPALLSVLIALAAIALLFVAYQYLGTQTKESTEVTVTGNSIVSNVAYFIRGAQKSDGDFITRYECKFSSCTESPTTIELAPTGYAATGLLRVSERVSDPELRTAANNAMKDILRKCADDVRMCERNFYALHTYYNETGDESYREALLQTGEHILDIIDSSSINDLVQREAYRKLEYLYNLTGEAKYRAPVVRDAEEALAAWPENFGDFVAYESDAYPIGFYMPVAVNDLFLPAYRLTEDERYLTATKDFFINAAVATNIHELWWERGLVFMLHAVEGLQALESLEPDENARFGTEARTLMREFVKWQYDSPERVIYNGDGGFRTGIISTEPTPGINYKQINLNGWFITLLAENEMLVNSDFQLDRNPPR